MAQVIHRTMGTGQEIQVVEEGAFRWLHFGSRYRQSCMELACPERLVLPYTRHMMAALLLAPEPSRVLQVGLGGGSLVRFFQRHWPRCRLDVVELEPAVVAVARQFFQLPPAPGLEIVVAEGSAFMAGADPGRYGGYQVILVDAFDANGMARQVAAESFVAHCAARLAPGGVLVFNLFQRDREGFLTVLEVLERQFGQLPLRLPVPGFGNEIVFSVNGPWPRPEQLAAPALRLERQVGLEMNHFLDRLSRRNVEWRRGWRWPWRR